MLLDKVLHATFITYAIVIEKFVKGIHPVKNLVAHRTRHLKDCLTIIYFKFPILKDWVALVVAKVYLSIFKHLVVPLAGVP